MSDSFNPILNNPYEEPTKYYETLLDGSLVYENIIKDRRPFIPDIVPVPKRPDPQRPISRYYEIGRASCRERVCQYV